MRSGGVCSIQHSLTPEAASVLKHSLLLSRRRGHAQLTPLHVAAVLLSSSSTLLNRACLATTTTTNNSLHSPRAALDLCFNVALNRLPASAAGAGQPTLSNALVAALKRAQSHHRRGSSSSSSSGAAAESPGGLLTTVKVDIEQLVISILDDPSVSRVMREAGFSSSAVKTTVVEGASNNMTLVKDGVLGLTFHANIINYNNSSVQGSRIRLSQQNPSRHELIGNRDDRQYLPNYYNHNSNMNNYNYLNNNYNYSYNYKLSFCSECASNCEKEVELMKTGNHKLPAWLRPNGTHTTPQKDELVELRKKWSRLCHSLHHQGSHVTQNVYSNNNIQGLNGNNNYVPWCPSNQNNIIFHDPKSSITFSDHDYQANPVRDFMVDPRLDARRSNRRGNDDDDDDDDGEETKITLGLGNSVGPRTESSRDEICQLLKDNVPWQSEAIPSIVEALIAKNETWLLLQGSDSIGKRRLARAIAESVIGSANSLVLLDGQRDKIGTLEMALKSTKKLVVLVEEIDNLIDTLFLKLLSDRFESPEFREGKCLIFILTKTDRDERRMKDKENSVIEMTLEIGDARDCLDRKRKRFGLENSNCRWKSSRIDLNVEAGLEEKEEEEMSRESSDLTRENDINGTKRVSFFESIESVFEFNRSPARDREMKEFFEAKMVSGCFNNGEETMAKICGNKIRFIVDESVLEELSFGSSCFTNSLFEKWERGVLENALKMVVGFGAKEKGKNGISFGGGDGLVVRLCLGGEKKEGINLVDGFMGSCLPNKIQILSHKD